MAYKITFKRSVSKDLKRIPKREAKLILNKIDRDLSLEAGNQPTLKGKFKGLRKFRIGYYRVLFVILNNEVLILKIAHRKDVYKK